jgi:DNA polymerase-3 subunit delta
MIPEGQRDFNLDRFYGGEAEIEDVLSVARTVPFLSPRRVVILRNVERVKLTAPRERLLTAYLKDPSPDTVFVALTEDSAAVKTWSKKFAGTWVEVVFRPLKGQSLRTAVRDLVRERGARIRTEAVDRLTEVVGGDLMRISQEVEKLALSVGPEGEIGVPDVHLLVCGYSYQTMFDLVKAVCDRNVAGGMTLISHLFEAGADPLGFIGMLARRLRMLWYLAKGRSQPPGAVPAAFRMQKWQLGELKGQAAGFSKEEIERLLGDLLRIDRMIKSEPVSARLLLERFVLSLDRKRTASAVS